jgi:DNA-binding phage protein
MNKLSVRAGYTRRNYGDWARGDISNPRLMAVLDYVEALGLQLLIAPRPPVVGGSRP